MLPLLAGAALGAGVGGLTNYFAGKEKEKEEKKEAMRQLYNRYMSGGDMMQFGKPVQEAPSMGESFAMPILNAGLSSLGQIPKKGEEQPNEFAQMAKGYLGATR